MTVSYAFGAARPLYEKRIHPRVLCGPSDIDRLRRETRRGAGRRIMEALRLKLLPVSRRILGADDVAKSLDFYGSGAWTGFAWQAAMAMRDLALVGLIDDDADALEAARRILLDASPGTAGGLAWGGMGAIAFDLAYDHLTPAERGRFIAQAADTVRRSVAAGRQTYFRNAGANTPLGTHMQTPLVALMAILGEPEAGDLSGELALAIRYLDATLHTAFNPDGYPEEDIGYGTDVAGGLAWVVEGLRRAGLYNAYDPARGCAHWPRLGRALLHFVQPWGEYLSMTGDHPNVFWNRELCLARIAAETGDPAVRWLLGAIEFTGKELADNPHRDFHVEVPLRKGFQVPATGLSLFVLDELVKPAADPGRARVPTAFRDRRRGIVSFRSGWDADATYVVFDGSQRSPAGQGHFHASCGHFSLTALGEYFAIAPGRYGIEQSQHNLVLVDGRSGRSTGGEWTQTSWHGTLTACEPGPFCDIAAVDSAHQHDCYWARRHLGLVKGPGAPAYAWTVEDINKADDYREFWWTLNTSPENGIALREAGATITGWRRGNHLDVHFALPDPAAYPKPHTLALAQDEATTSSFKYVTNPRERAAAYARPGAMVNGIPFVRPRLIAKVAGYNGRFMSIMLPRPAGRPPARVERLPTLDNVLAVRIDFEEVTDTLVWAYEHLLLEAGDVEARGQWCVVRRRRSDGRLLRWALGKGDVLRVGGRLVSPRAAKRAKGRR